MADSAVLDFLATRRSTPFPLMADEGPDAAQLASILTIAARIPDHGKLAPWRFIVIGREGAALLGAFCAETVKTDNPQADDLLLAAESARFTRSPVTVTVVVSPKEHPKVPVYEQDLSAGALCYNMELAAMAHGFGANWITGWPAFDKRFHEKLGLKGQERIAGFVHIGRALSKAEDRERPQTDAITRFFP